MGTYINRILAIFWVMTLLSACKPPGGKTSDGTELDVCETTDSSSAIIPEYAKGFSVRYLANGVRLVDVKDPQKGEEDEAEESDGQAIKSDSPHANMPNEYKLALVEKGFKGEIPEGYTLIEVPVERIICMTSLQISNFTALNSHENIVGITGTKNLFDKDILARVEEGSIVKIGMEGNFDTEKVIASQPDLIIISPFKRGGYETIKETGITLIPHLGYKEPDPLGQAEWIKYVSMFIGKEEEANKIFEGIRDRYNSVKSLTANVSSRPSVFSGEMHGGNWFAIGGRNYLAKMFQDAGAEYVFSDDNHSGGIPIDFERMYKAASDADYWRILNSFQGDFSYDALKSSDSRNEDFKAFRQKHVIYCNMKAGPYYEITPVEPDVVLKDLVFVFHPELLPSDFQPTFYKLLK